MSGAIGSSTLAERTEPRAAAFELSALRQFTAWLAEQHPAEITICA